MKTTEILIAGFGGQGILFSGKFLAYKGLLEELQVSWLPSYGPEMRGGTANCNVIISDTPVGSPIVTAPSVLIAMNLPSLEKYVNTVGIKSVQEVYSGTKYYKADEGWVITTAPNFSRQAIRLAKSLNVKLIDRQQLEQILKNVNFYK